MKGNRNSDDYRRRLRLEATRATGWLNVILVLSVAAVAYTDWVVVANVSLGYLYVLPIALSALVNRLRVTAALVVLCTWLADLFGPPADSVALRLARAAISLAGFLIVAYLVTLIARQRECLAAEVERQRDEYERDLELAAQVERQVLPRPPSVPGLEIAAAMQTARLLGGDYYDFFPVSDGVLDVVIADVSGKGAAASLLMPSLAVALRLSARELSGPAEIIKDLDGVLRQITNPATFVTIFYARFHVKPGAPRSLQYASGGHNPPLLLRQTSGEVIHLEQAGPIVGILPDAEFSNTVVPLEQGDILALYTDGVTEQENAGGDELGVERLEETLRSCAREHAAEMITHVTDAVAGFAGAVEQADDLTVVVVKVVP